MCTGLEIAAVLASAALSGGGAYIANNEAQQNAKSTANAENAVLAHTMANNQTLADNARAAYNTRVANLPTQLPADQTTATAARTAPLTTAIASAAPENVPIEGSAPAVVKDDLNSRLATATNAVTGEADALGGMGGYTDTWFNEGLKDAGVQRQVAMNDDLIKNNMALLTPEQQLAGITAYKPSSGVGQIMQAAGNTLGSAAGSGGLTKVASMFGPSIGPWTTTTFDASGNAVA